MNWKPTIEKYYPVGLGLALSGGALFYYHDQYLPTKTHELVSTAINIAGIAVGFLATSQALVYSLKDNHIVKQLINLELFDPLLKYFSAAIRWCFAVAIFGAAAFFVKFPEAGATPIAKPMLLHSLCFSAWIGICATAGASCYRVINIFWKIIHR